MKKLNIFFKVAACSFLAGLLLSISMVIFVLLPVYGLVGSQVSTEVADARLNAASAKLVAFNILIIVIAIVMVGSLVVGVYKELGRKKHKGEDGF